MKIKMKEFWFPIMECAIFRGTITGQSEKHGDATINLSYVLIIYWEDSNCQKK